ncbi:hypothetical protein MN086_08650 [Sulfurovum sp. XGS-02]|uniref:hypothetical protein n=1 Tax=Sulfurovum sp. XGS-02 TaxID=2925411 RepID=UPI0020463A84|nr:hypothetical protein [Sulfurovum sp. XGS-02]UPT77117.1 hypothetical protein MN086_08650 [Sulfurovum sp. XGS-02]
MQNLYEEIIVLGLLLFAVFGIYLMLKVHYHFAFGLMKNTASYEKYHLAIDRAKEYLFFTLKVLLWLALIGMLAFGSYYLWNGISLKAFLFELWAKIPEGFWLEAFFVIIRIAVIIALSRYVLKIVYAFLDKNQQKAIENRCESCREITIVKFYTRLHNMVKYTVLLGILYRITLFFTFLDVVSRGLWILLIVYFIVSVGLLAVNGLTMMKEKRGA